VDPEWLSDWYPWNLNYSGGWGRRSLMSKGSRLPRAPQKDNGLKKTRLKKKEKEQKGKIQIQSIRLITNWYPSIFLCWEPGAGYSVVKCLPNKCEGPEFKLQFWQKNRCPSMNQKLQMSHTHPQGHREGPEVSGAHKIQWVVVWGLGRREERSGQRAWAKLQPLSNSLRPHHKKWP
jgi:hypothetical protein